MVIRPSYLCLAVSAFHIGGSLAPSEKASCLGSIIMVELCWWCPLHFLFIKFALFDFARALINLFKLSVDVDPLATCKLQFLFLLALDHLHEGLDMGQVPFEFLECVISHF